MRKNFGTLLFRFQFRKFVCFGNNELNSETELNYEVNNNMSHKEVYSNSNILQENDNKLFTNYLNI